MFWFPYVLLHEFYTCRFAYTLAYAAKFDDAGVSACSLLVSLRERVVQLLNCIRRSPKYRRYIAP